MAVDLTWDSMAYHLPFSALRVGLMTPWQFQRAPPEKDIVTGYYLGFPILADLLRGWMWRFSRWPDAVNLLGPISLLALAGYLKWAFRRLQVAWVLIGILAIPAVQTAAAGNYVDLPANAAYTIYLLSIVELWTSPEKFKRPAPWIVLFLAAFVAANIKLQTSVFVCLAMPFIVPPAWRLLRERKAGSGKIAGAALLGIGASMLMAVNLIKNLLLYGNPFYPIDMTIAGIHLSGPVTHDAWLLPGRPYEHVAQPIVTLLSVLEYRSLDGRIPPYTNGMGNVPFTSVSASMGGFFSALVVASIGFLVIAVIRRRDRLSKVALVTCIVTGIAIAFFPNSSNLRYETFWMMSLIIFCLLLLRQQSLGVFLQCYKIVIVSSLVFVTSVTAAVSFIPKWNPMQRYVDHSGADQMLSAIVKPGDVICLEQGPGAWDNRFTIMFAPIFHKELAKERPYAIKEGFCAGYKTLPRGKF